MIQYFLKFFLEKLDLKYIYTDHSIFILDIVLKNLLLDVFINNIKIMASKNSAIIQYIKTELMIVFSISKMGLISFYSELKIDYNYEQ